ncbi:MAG: hypothetical protein HOV80_12645 [Polyangiaceae bacterium]|nr:hypothetical protein [Polyangiaceae bacterium]
MSASSAAPSASATATPSNEPKPTLPTDGLCLAVRSGEATYHVYRRGPDVVTLRLVKGDDAEGIRFGAFAIDATFASPKKLEEPLHRSKLPAPSRWEVVHHRVDEAVRVVESAELGDGWRKEESEVEYDARGRKTFDRGKQLQYSGVDLKDVAPLRILPITARELGLGFSSLVSMGYVEWLQDARRPFSGTRTTLKFDGDEVDAKIVDRFDAKGRLIETTQLDRNLEGNMEVLGRVRWRWEGEEAVEMKIIATAADGRAEAVTRFIWSGGKLIRVEEQWSETKGGKTTVKPTNPLADLSYDDRGRLVRFNDVSFEYGPAWESCGWIVW